MYATTAEERRATTARELAAALYVEHRAHLIGVACANSRRRAEAEDAVQEAMAMQGDHRRQPVGRGCEPGNSARPECPDPVDPLLLSRESKSSARGRNS